jgi:hypothetical protein
MRYYYVPHINDSKTGSNHAGISRLEVMMKIFSEVLGQEWQEIAYCYQHLKMKENRYEA